MLRHPVGTGAGHCIMLVHEALCNICVVQSTFRFDSRVHPRHDDQRSFAPSRVYLTKASQGVVGNIQQRDGGNHHVFTSTGVTICFCRSTKLFGPSCVRRVWCHAERFACNFQSMLVNVVGSNYPTWRDTSRT